MIAQKVSEAVWPAAAAVAFSRVNSNSTAAAQGSAKGYGNQEATDVCGGLCNT